MLSHSTDMGGYRNAGRRGRRPLRRKWNGFDLPEPLCHPTFASPLPPSYEEGAPRRGRARIIGTVLTTHLVGAATPGGPHAVGFVYRKHPLRSTGSNTPPPRRHPFFRKRGRGNKVAALRAAFIKNCAAKRRKTFLVGAGSKPARPPAPPRGQIKTAAKPQPF